MDIDGMLTIVVTSQGMEAKRPDSPERVQVAAGKQDVDSLDVLPAHDGAECALGLSYILELLPETIRRKPYFQPSPMG